MRVTTISVSWIISMLFANPERELEKPSVGSFGKRFSRRFEEKSETLGQNHLIIQNSWFAYLSDYFVLFHKERGLHDESYKQV